MKTLVITSASILALAGASAAAQTPTKGPEAIKHLNEMEYQRLADFEQALESTVEVAVISQDSNDVAVLSTEEAEAKQSTKWASTEPTTKTQVQEGVGGEYYATRAEAERNAYLDATIAEIAMSDPQFSTLVELVQMAGLDDELNGAGEFTVFAPTNAAFAKLGVEKLDELKRDPDELARILKSHVVEGTYLASDVPTTETELDTIGDAKLFIERDEAGMIKASAAAVERADIIATNGVIHVIDTVIIPEYESGSVLTGAVGR